MSLKIKMYAVTLISLAALAGCANKGPESGHTAKWYETHTSAQAAEILWCGKQSPAVEQDNSSCRAANAASETGQKAFVHGQRQDAALAEHGHSLLTLPPVPIPQSTSR